MNLTQKLQQLRRARALRPCLRYHDDFVAGIEVPDSDFDTTLQAVKGLFKAFKATGFIIDVDHWGAILITTPERPTVWELSVCLAAPTLPIADMTAQLKVTTYLKLNAATDTPKLYLRTRAWQRHGTNWIWQPLPSAPLLPTSYEAFIHRILARARKLTNASPKTDPSATQVRLPDVLAVLRYDAHLSQGKSLEQACYPRLESYWIQACKLEQGVAIFQSGFNTDVRYSVGRTGQRLLKRLLPEYGEISMEFQRPF